MKITNIFVNALWNLSGQRDKTDIQTIRLFLYIFEKWNDKYKINISLRELYIKTFSYRDENNKIHYMMSWRDYTQFIAKMGLTNWDLNTNIIRIYFDNDLFRINGTKKKDHNKLRELKKGQNSFDDIGPYQEYSYKNLKKEIWDKIRITKSSYEIKLFFFILSEMMRGPFQYITADLEDIMSKTMIISKYKRKIKYKMKKILNKFIEMEFIAGYTTTKTGWIIQKYKKV